MSGLERKLLVSFSAGETSGYMTQWILRNWRDRYDRIEVVMANTSQENEQTLIFADRCDRLLFQPLGANLTIVEGVQHHGVRRGPSARVVNYLTASRDGSVFEDAIKKYGIPNSKFKDCTRNLKRKPIEWYAREVLGWANGSYDLAIGIRVDEIDRISVEAATRRIVYPLVKEHPRTKTQINTWWRAQPFRLELKGYQGNCRWCWKKSMRKHITLIRENPRQYDFPHRMEQKYGRHGPEFLKDPATQERPITDDYRRVFFRGNMSVTDILSESLRRGSAFVPAEDDAVIYDEELDTAGACDGESCEVFTDGDGEWDEDE